jgi:hypothetical protein
MLELHGFRTLLFLKHLHFSNTQNDDNTYKVLTTAMFRDLKTLKPGGIRTRDADVMATMHRVTLEYSLIFIVYTLFLTILVYFHTKNPNFGTFWKALEWKSLVYFTSIWYIYL